jgi:hypothetical protein
MTTWRASSSLLPLNVLLDDEQIGHAVFIVIIIDEPTSGTCPMRTI